MKMQNRYLCIVISVLVMIGLMTGCTSQNSDTKVAETVIIGEDLIYAAAEEGKTSSAIAVKDGMIAYIGDRDGVQEWIGEKTNVIQLDSGMVLPSFFEAHAHGHEGGLAELFEVNLYEADSVEAYQDLIRQFIEERADREFIIGSGWINGYAPAGGFTAALLDEVSTDKPIALISADHHSWWVNTKVLEMAEVTKETQEVPGGVIERDAKGNPSGVFRENANALITAVIPDYTVDELKQGILAYQQEVAGYGITAYWEPMVNLRKNMLQAYRELDDAGALILRVYGGYQLYSDADPLGELDQIAGLMKESRDEDFVLNGVKILVDGVVEGHTAYLLDDYTDTPGERGTLLWDQDLLNETVAKADKMGIIAHIHAIGDGAVKTAVDAYAYAAEKNGTTDSRHAITHLQIVDPVDIDRMGDLHVIAVTNPYWFCKEPGYFYELEVPYLGEERANSEYPMKAFFDAGVVVNMASDYPVTIPSRPLDAIQTGVIRCDRFADPETLQNPEQRVTVEQMLKAATLNGAYGNFTEDIFGTLEVGKSADLVILDRNLFGIEPAEISQTNVLKTMLKGEFIFDLTN